MIEKAAAVTETGGLYRRTVLPLLRDRHLYVLAALMAVGLVLHYGDDIQILKPLGEAAPWLFIHSVHIPFFILPVGYASWHFGLRGGAVTLVGAIVVLLLHLDIAEEPEDWHLNVYLSASLTLYSALVVWGVGRAAKLRGERERESARVAESETMYRALVESAPNGIFLVDEEGNFREANTQGAIVYGYTRDELLHMNVRDTVPPGEGLMVLPLALEQGSASGERLSRRRDGSLFPSHINAVKIALNGQRMVLGVVRDLTEQKALEALVEQESARLSESEEKYRTLVESAPDGIFLVDDRGNYLDVNPAACAAFGYTREEFLRMSIRDLLPPGLEPRLFSPAMEQGHARGEVVLMGKDGALLPTELSVAKLNLGGRTVLLGIHRDMTQQKRLERDLMEANSALLEGSHLHIHSLAVAMEARDPYTRGHEDRVRDYALQVARQLGLPLEEADNLAHAGELHDLGKLATPDSILLKQGALDPAEWAEIRRHPERGVELLQHILFLKDVLPIIRAHHERYDGKGYPDGLAGESIPLGARILAVSDAYDAMTSARSYRLALTHQEAIHRLRDGAGSQWDPRVVGAFLMVMGEQDVEDPSLDNEAAHKR